jgi:hypothetical protein
MDLLVRLGLAIETETGIEIIGETKALLTSNEIMRYQKLHQNFIKLWKYGFTHKYGSPRNGEELGIQITYKKYEVDPIVHWLNAASTATRDTTYLFKNIKHNSTYKHFFIDWDVKIQIANISSVSPKKAKSNSGAPVVNECIIIEDDDAADSVEAIDKGMILRI